MNRSLCFAVLFVTCASLLPAQVVRTFVSTSGSDVNPCTKAAPCRNFAAAIDAVDAGGEVVVLDSGGYGPVEIEKSVGIFAPAGVHAAIAPTSGRAINISGTDSDKVTIRGLVLNGQGAQTGIWCSTAESIQVEDCFINGFTGAGITKNTGNDLFVTNVTISNSPRGIFTSALVIAPGTPTVWLDRVRILNLQGFEGIRVGEFITINVRDSVIANGGDPGVVASGSGVIHLENTHIINHVSEGVTVNTQGTVRISNCTVTGNVTGLNASGGTITSFDNNKVIGNGTNIVGTLGFKDTD